MLQEFAGGVGWVLEIDSYEGQFRAGMGRRIHVRRSYSVPPRAGDFSRFVYMAVECQHGLAGLDKAPDGYASHMDIQGHTFHGLPIHRSPVELRLVGRRVENQYSPG